MKQLIYVIQSTVQGRIIRRLGCHTCMEKWHIFHVKPIFTFHNMVAKYCDFEIPLEITRGCLQYYSSTERSRYVFSPFPDG